MPKSTKQRLDAEIEKLEASIGPEIKLLKDLVTARSVIERLPKDDDTQAVRVKRILKKRKRSKRSSPRKYGDKSIPEYVIEVGRGIQPFTCRELRLAIKKEYGFYIKPQSLSAAMSKLHLYNKKLHQVRIGVYTLIGENDA